MTVQAKKKRRPTALATIPLQPSEALAAIVGSSPLPRTQATARLWAYIKKYGLQDKKNRRMINPDAALAAVVGGAAQLSMFEMTKQLGKHLAPYRAVH